MAAIDPGTLQAVILAAGRGTRMRPVSDRIPKPLIPINGRPFLGHLLDIVADTGIAAASTVVVVRYLKDQVKDFLTAYAPSVRSTEQPRLDGTAGALFCAMSHLDPARPVLMLMGDNFYSRRDVAAMCGAGTHAIGCIRSGAPERYGVVETGGTPPRVTRIVEKPVHYFFERYVLISTGLHLFLPSFHHVLHEEVAVHRRREMDGEIPLTDAVNRLAAAETVAPVELDDWRDMGCPEDIPAMAEWVLQRADK
ncbi:NTP transferase domain-containing protein [bacterium]|nr:NTP transferase domain-containing protein [candidate division CSSED10-310 bacterium]